MVNAAKLASAKRITAVIPWYFYARQDKKSRPREPITARLVADLLETAGVDRVITMDLHAGQVQGFFRIPVDHMVAVPMFAQHIRDYLGTEVERVAVAPDTGRAKLAGKFAEMIGGGLVVLNKERPGHNQAKVTGVIGDVDGKVAVMTDDIIDTAGTLCAGAEALREAGATRVIACATHALFNDPALERIAESAFEKRRRHRHGAGRRAEQAAPTSRCSRSPACSPRRSRTCSPTTPSRRSSRARTSCSSSRTAHPNRVNPTPSRATRVIGYRRGGNMSESEQAPSTSDQREEASAPPAEGAPTRWGVLMRNPKRLIIALVLIVVAISAAAFASATFTSTSANPGNLATTGSLLIENSEDGAILTATGLVPGDTRNGSVTISNVGDSAGNFSLTTEDLVDTPPTPPLSGRLDLLIEDITVPATPTETYKAS